MGLWSSSSDLRVFDLVLQLRVLFVAEVANARRRVEFVFAD